MKTQPLTQLNEDVCASGILDVFESTEIANLIQDGQKLEIHITRPIIAHTVSLEDIKDNDCVYDLRSDMKNKKIGKVTNKTNYYLETLNGINRRKDTKTGIETCYEERCFVVTDSSNQPVIVTIRNKCASNLIPIIVDYDQNLEIEEQLFENNLRETKRGTDSCLDIIHTLDCAIIIKGTDDDILNEVKKIINNFNRTFENMFK